MGALREHPHPLRRPCTCRLVAVRESNGQLVCAECAAALVLTKQPNAAAQHALIRAQRRVERCADELTDALEALREAQKC